MHPLKHLALMTLLGTDTSGLRAYWQRNGSLPRTAAITRTRPAAPAEPAVSAFTSRRGRFLDELKVVAARRTRDYVWLYRHDYQWLKEAISQSARPRQPATDHVNWDERDRQFALLVRNHNALLVQADQKARISATLLAKATGRPALVEKFADKLPLTTQTIRALEESVEMYQCRRVRRIVREYQAKGEALVRWRVLRIAGLPAPLAPAVERELTALLNSFRFAGESPGPAVE